MRATPPGSLTSRTPRRPGPLGTDERSFTTYRNLVEPGGWQAKSVAVCSWDWVMMSMASGVTTSVAVTS